LKCSMTARLGGQLFTQDRVELHLNGQSLDQYSDGHISDVAILYQYTLRLQSWQTFARQISRTTQLRQNTG
jgi:hypothetical protein